MQVCVAVPVDGLYLQGPGSRQATLGLQAVQRPPKWNKMPGAGKQQRRVACVLQPVPSGCSSCATLLGGSWPAATAVLPAGRTAPLKVPQQQSQETGGSSSYLQETGASSSCLACRASSSSMRATGMPACMTRVAVSTAPCAPAVVWVGGVVVGVGVGGGGGRRPGSKSTGFQRRRLCQGCRQPVARPNGAGCFSKPFVPSVPPGPHLEVGKGADSSGGGLWLAVQAQRHLGDHPQRALAAHKQGGQVVARGALAHAAP